MPTTFIGLVIFLAFLTPGFLHYIQRRSLVPQKPLSPLVETATLTTVSLLTNVVVIALFGVARGLATKHTPDIGLLLAARSAYARRHVAYLLEWACVGLVASSLLGILLARWAWLRALVTDRFTPVISEVSAWYQFFEETPPRHYSFVGCELKDGSYVGGRLAWYSTEVVESGDRDLVLAPPFRHRSDAGTDDLPGVERVIVSAREVTRFDISYVQE